MDDNAFILDWTMDDFDLLQQKLADARLTVNNEDSSPHIRVSVPLPQAQEFASICQQHLNALFNYVDVQFPEAKQTMLVFRQKILIITNEQENRDAVTWALAQGLPQAQADWPTSF